MLYNSVIYALLIVLLTYKINPSQYKAKDVPYTAVWQQHTGGQPYPRVICSKTYRSYGKPQIIPNAIY